MVHARLVRARGDNWPRCAAHDFCVLCQPEPAFPTMERPHGRLPGLMVAHIAMSGQVPRNRDGPDCDRRLLLGEQA